MIQKEIRALAPTFAATLLLTALTTFQEDWLAIPVYYFGAMTLGALSVGHEYSSRTLSMLLAQPVSRARLLRAKVLVLVPMLLALLVVAAARLPLRRGDDAMVMVWMPPVAALCLAPWLTMITRNVIAGAVFSAGLPGTVWGICELIALAVYGETRAGNTFRLVLYSVAASAICATGAILAIRTFLNLEVIDGRDAPLELPRALRGSSDARWLEGTRRNAVWMLVKKELHLQQLTFAVAGAYVSTFLAIWLLIKSGSPEADDVFTIVTVLYAVMLAVLVGALSSAEERHFGTLDWQLMLPFASAWQWTIKVATSLTLALLLAVGLPSLFTVGFDPARRQFIVLVIVITSCAMYVSSRSSSGIRALLVSFAVLPVAVLLIRAADPFEFPIDGDAAVMLIGLVLAVVALRRGLIHYRTLPAGSAR